MMRLAHSPGRAPSPCWLHLLAGQEHGRTPPLGASDASGLLLSIGMKVACDFLRLSLAYSDILFGSNGDATGDANQSHNVGVNIRVNIGIRALAVMPRPKLWGASDV
jgi:hypothetical protein